MTAQTGRSLKLSAEELEKANIALWKFGSKADLAASLEMSRTTLNNFFKGDPVQRKQFHAICKKLKFDWQPPAIEKPQPDNLDVDVIVQTIREQIKPLVHQKCGTMRVLDMEQPIELTGERGIYTNVNILERLTGRRRFDIADLQNCGVEEFDRAGLSQVTKERVPGLEAVGQHRKLMVLGKPGAGKSTFLKYLAMQCIEGNFQANRIPVFITLKDFAEIKENPDLFTYISQLVELPTSDALRKILQQGQMLMLLDGLDEVREEDTKRVLRQILKFSDQFHLNQFVMTCRIAAKEYTFERFTEVEVADFDEEQISLFAQNWFRRSDPMKAKRFVQKLKENEPIQELTSSPLLLTLLCLVFQEKEDFPKKRSDLYQEGIEILLETWDAKRGIERDELYKNLSLKKKQALLRQIALATFEQQNYFFKPELIEEIIEDFFCKLSSSDFKKEDLEVDSKAVLRAIEAQHGLLIERAKNIYSFSHLTFQEYFVAREIVANSAYENLVEHLNEKRWREVFLLTTSMMRNADDLLRLIKQTIDRTLPEDEKLQEFLRWVNQKSDFTEAPYKPSSIRDFYCEVALDLDHALYHNLDATFKILRKRMTGYANKFSRRRESYRVVVQDLLLARVLARTHDFNSIHSLNSILDDGCPWESIFEYDLVKRQNNFNRHLFNNSVYSIYELNDILDDGLDCWVDYYQHRINSDPDPSMHYYYSLAEAEASALFLDPELKRKLQEVRDQLPIAPTSWRNRGNLEQWLQNFKQWWQDNGQAWTEQLKAIMTQHRNIGHNWQFSDEQKEVLRQYCYASSLLLNCLDRVCDISQDVRQEIEYTLLLPSGGMRNEKWSGINGRLQNDITLHQQEEANVVTLPVPYESQNDITLHQQEEADIPTDIPTTVPFNESQNDITLHQQEEADVVTTPFLKEWISWSFGEKEEVTDNFLRD